MFKNINWPQIVSIVVISLFIGVVFVYANWSSPPASPPGCPSSNSACNAPINASAISQYKEGALGVGGVFQVFSDAVFKGNVRIGTTDVSSDIINWSLSGTADGSGDGGSIIGSSSNIKDNNVDTAYGNGCVISSGYLCEWSYVDTITFSDIIETINKVEIYHKGTVINDAYASAEENWEVNIYSDGAWHKIMSGSGHFNKITNSNSTGWSDVSKIQVKAQGGAYSESSSPVQSFHETYELRAWGYHVIKRGDLNVPNLIRDSCFWTDASCGQMVCPESYFLAGIERPASANEQCWGKGNDYDEPWTKLYCCKL